MAYSPPRVFTRSGTLMKKKAEEKCYIIINSLSLCDAAHFHPWLQFYVPTL